MPPEYRRSLVLVIMALCVSCTSLNKSSSTVASSLPQECQEQIPHLTDEYRIFGGYGEESCKLAAQSPDGTLLAYVRLEEKKRPRTNSLHGAEAAKIIRRDSVIPAEIYRSVRFSIMALEWLDDGRLLIWDAPTDLAESPGITAIYDPQAGGITHRLPFPLEERVTFWNTQKTAFYTGIFIPMESQCTEYMGGYDFARDRELPPFEPVIKPDQHVRIVGSPVWSENGTQLLISVSSGTLIGDSPCGDGQIEWNPSSVMMLDLDEQDLRPVMVKGDSDHNYYLQIDSDGQYEIVAEPYVPSNSQCCRCC